VDSMPFCFENFCPEGVPWMTSLRPSPRCLKLSPPYPWSMASLLEGAPSLQTLLQTLLEICCQQKNGTKR